MPQNRSPTGGNGGFPRFRSPAARARLRGITLTPSPPFTAARMLASLDPMNTTSNGRCTLFRLATPDAMKGTDLAEGDERHRGLGIET